MYCQAAHTIYQIKQSRREVRIDTNSCNNDSILNLICQAPTLICQNFYIPFWKRKSAPLIRVIFIIICHCLFMSINWLILSVMLVCVSPAQYLYRYLCLLHLMSIHISLESLAHILNPLHNYILVLHPTMIFVDCMR